MNQSCEGCAGHPYQKGRSPCKHCKEIGADKEPMSAADHERALQVIDARTDLTECQRKAMRNYVEAHYIASTKNG